MIERFIRLFGSASQDCLTADREFVGEHWINYLNCFQAVLPGKRGIIEIFDLLGGRLEIENVQDDKQKISARNFNGFPLIVKFTGENSSCTQVIGNY